MGGIDDSDEIERKVEGERATGEKKSKLNLLDFYDYCALTFSPSPGTSIDTTNNNKISTATKSSQETVERETSKK